MNYKIAVIPGDGIGPEIVREACKVLDRVGEIYGHTFEYTKVLMGGASIDVHGIPLTDEALQTARESDSVLLGATSAIPDGMTWRQICGRRPGCWLSGRDSDFLPIYVRPISIKSLRTPAL